MQRRIAWNMLARTHHCIAEVAEVREDLDTHPCLASALASNPTQPSRQEPPQSRRRRFRQPTQRQRQRQHRPRYNASEDRAAVREHRDLCRHGRQARVLLLERVASLCVEEFYD